MGKQNESSVSRKNAIGERLREIRTRNGWTLASVSKKTGISVGTLSKLENGRTELNFTTVNKLAQGLQLPVTDLTNPSPMVLGRRAITLGGDGEVFETEDIRFEVLCSDITPNNQAYVKAEIVSHKIDPDMDWHRHDGQEFILVTKGTLELHTEFYSEPVVLKTGDSILFDSSMGHHYVSKGRGNAEALLSMTMKGYENIADSFRSSQSRSNKQR